jgi:hypothetical protein
MIDDDDDDDVVLSSLIVQFLRRVCVMHWLSSYDIAIEDSERGGHVNAVFEQALSDATADLKGYIAASGFPKKISHVDVQMAASAMASKALLLKHLYECGQGPRRKLVDPLLRGYQSDKQVATYDNILLESQH